MQSFFRTLQNSRRSIVRWKNQGVLLSHVGNSSASDGTANEWTYVCLPLVKENWQICQ